MKTDEKLKKGHARREPEPHNWHIKGHQKTMPGEENLESVPQRNTFETNRWEEHTENWHAGWVPQSLMGLRTYTQKH